MSLSANINLKSESITLAPNGIRVFNCTGNFFFCRSASSPFSISIDGNQEIAIDQGISFPTPQTFRSIIFRDTGGAGVTITFFAGSGPILYASQNLTVTAKNAPSYAKNSGVLAIADGGTRAFTGLNGVDVRKSFLIYNRGGTLLEILDPSNAVGIPVPSGSPPLAFEVSGAVTVSNPAGSGAGSYSVMEIFNT